MTGWVLLDPPLALRAAKLVLQVYEPTAEITIYSWKATYITPLICSLQGSENIKAFISQIPSDEEACQVLRAT